MAMRKAPVSDPWPRSSAVVLSGLGLTLASIQPTEPGEGEAERKKAPIVKLAFKTQNQNPPQEPRA